MLLPQPATDLDLAFPASVLGTFLPRPTWVGESLNPWLNSPWGRLADSIFAGQLPDLELTMEHDLQLVSRHIRVCMGSYQPRHQEKIAGVAFLLALWMDVAWPEDQLEAARPLQAEARAKNKDLAWEVKET